MKKGTLAGIILAVVGLIALGALFIYLTVQYKDDVFAPETAVESEADALLSQLRQTETEPETTAAPVSAEHPSDNYSPKQRFIIWVGDSRTVGMKNAVKNDDLYIGASGEGYNWLSETGLPLVKDAISDHPDAPVVFNFGVNDYDNMENYLALYESLLEEYPDTHFYFLSVNSIDPEICKNITNDEITDFNNHLKQSFPDAYIDSYTFLLINETITIDGIHYSEDDYRSIHAFAAKEVGKKEDRLASSSK